MKARILTLLSTAALLGGCVTTQPQPPMALPQPQLDVPPKSVNGAIYQAGHDVRLYEDRVARRVGDLVTVVLEEETDASKAAKTSVAKDSTTSLPTPTIAGMDAKIGSKVLDFSATAERDFAGEGASDQSNELSGVLTAIVVQRQPNGNLVIQGQKKLTLNRGDEYVTITGIVRQEDIRPDNTISSTRVANAQISYTGTGELADANTMGWLSRLFNSVIWPF